MEIYVVRPGDSLYRIARKFHVPMDQLLRDNQLPDPSRLSVGQVLVVQFPAQTYTVRQGDTLSSIAQAHDISLRQLLRNNFGLSRQAELPPGQTIVLAYQQSSKSPLSVNGYAYPHIEPALLADALPYLSSLTPFTYGLTADGGLIPLEDQRLLHSAFSSGVQPLLHLSAQTEDGGFSGELAHTILNDPAIQDRTAEDLLQTIRSKGYAGLDIDFEYLPAEDASLYAQFVGRMRQLLSPMGLPVLAALAPKAFAAQPGTLYEGHNYRLLGQAADRVLLMTYEWGYTYGPPMAVAPIRNVRQVVEYALTEIPAHKIWLGIPTYGYDWTLPYTKGRKAISLSNPRALSLAAEFRVSIRYDETAQSPWFSYTDCQGQPHEVWFEDARSIRAKLSLAAEYGLAGVGYWNLMRPFPQNWVLLNALYQVQDPPPL